ncbi:MAG: hypothetical protein Q4D41_12815, partial [Prevotellaceae bacterium]|nr:hypothetical protein [Prevotellaceae bacterium]
MLLLTAMLSFGFSACSDDDEDSGSSSSIIGTWSCYKDVYEDKETGDIETDYDCYEVIEFKSDGSGTREEGMIDMTWSVRNGRLYIYAESNNTYVLEYTVNKNELILVEEDDDYIYTSY